MPSTSEQMAFLAFKGISSSTLTHKQRKGSRNLAPLGWVCFDLGQGPEMERKSHVLVIHTPTFLVW